MDGEQGSAPSSGCVFPPFTSPWCVLLVLYFVSLVAGGEQGSTPPSPMCNRYLMLFVISTMLRKGRGLDGVGPMGFVVVCVWRGAGLRIAVKLFSVV